MEQVMVVARSGFFEGDWPQGFHRVPEPAEFLRDLESAAFFVPRLEAEHNPLWKQPIPYCMVFEGDRILVVLRTHGQSERRLHGLHSIGLGGHVEPGDQRPGSMTFARALRRELGEELVVPALDTLQPSFLGLLNDDSNAVGRVHVGLVYSLQVGPAAGLQKPVRIRETSKMIGGFRSLVESENLWQDRSRFETWSRVLLKALAFPDLRGTGAPVRLADSGREDEHG